MSRLPQHSPEFILCMGDDRTDEQMFQLVQQQQHIEKVCKCIVVVRYLCRWCGFLGIYVHRWEKIYQSKLPSTRYTYRFIDSGSIGDRRSCDRKLVTCTFQVIDYSSYSRCTLGSRYRFGKYRYDETHIGLHSYKAIVTLYCNNHHAYTLLQPYIYTHTHIQSVCVYVCVGAERMWKKPC